MKQEGFREFEKAGLPVKFLRNPSENMEAMARAIAENRGVESGLVCALSALEPSPTFEQCAFNDCANRGTHMVRRIKPCQAIYHYQIHPENALSTLAPVGWMYAQLQTWFPFNIQVGMNGREWLARQMEPRTYHN